MWIEAHVQRKPVLIGTFYRPPNADASVLLDIETSIDLAIDTGINDIIITGDLNVDYLKENTRKKIADICNQYTLTQIIDEPTHFTEHSSSLIDIIVVNNNKNIVLSGVGEPFLSQNIRYHCPIYCFYKLRKEPSINIKRKIYFYDRGDYDSLREEISKTDWSELKSEDINTYSSNISNHIATLSDKYIPNKFIMIRSSDPPWLDNNIRKMIRKRRRLYNKAKHTKLLDDMNIFRRYRNEVTKTIRNAKQTYLDKLSDNLKTKSLSSRDWWKTLKSFIKSPDDNAIPPLIYNDEVYSCNKDKANLLNNYFASQSNLHDDNAELPNLSINDEAPVLENISLHSHEVKDVLLSLKLGKSSGPDGINNRVLKELSSQISDPLCTLFNFSLSHSVVPDSWKEANVTPIHKKDDKSDISNYRPISLLNTIGKVFEKLVNKHVYNFFVSNNIISCLQSGFVQGDSTVNQLVSIYNTFCNALDDGKEVRAVFLDISKAFDRVWHKGLLLKLNSVGIRGSLLLWFSDYLTNRRQRVVLPGDCSDWTLTKAGVPQGSILGPLLFLIFINDIVSDIETNIRLFADDTSLYIIVETPQSAARKLNNDLSKIKAWASKWLVSFNPSKSESLLISRKRSNINHPDLCMDNNVIQEVNSHKHLGLTFSNDGTWHEHITNITSKAWTRINVMRKLKFKLDRRALEIIYFTFIRPILEYACVIFDNCTQYELNDIEKVQLEAARIVSGTTKLVSLALLYEELGWEQLSSRRRKYKLVLFYKMQNGLCPAYLTQLVPDQVGQASSYNLRNDRNLQTIHATTQLYYNSFLPSVIRDWNTLPSSIRTLPTVESFKRSLNTQTYRKPSFYFCGDRFGQIHHTRLRTNCSSLRYYLYHKGIIDNPNCDCGSLETNNHYLFECNRYNAIRVDLLNEVSEFCTPSLNSLLFGNLALSDEANELIFKSVHKFIRRSKRFEHTE